MGRNTAALLIASLLALGPLTVLSDDHMSTHTVMCINETHYAVRDYEHDNDEDDHDEDDYNMSNTSNMSDSPNVNVSDMGEWIVMETTNSTNPCAHADCNATCNATSCEPTYCALHTATTTGGQVLTAGSNHAACTGGVALLSFLAAFFSN
mmetsp:Transcript_69242/g.129264  ORF Transcript_69242/g.129264 Transcript_69242/m.129264 type:complete len:151 (+) Transcript_69242:85-537(+)